MRFFYTLLLTCAISIASVQAQQTVWNGNVSQNWSDAANWSAGVPTTSSTAFVPSAATNWPRATNLSIDFLLQNAGRIFLEGKTDNFNNIQNFDAGVILVSGTGIHHGPFAFDNHGSLVILGSFLNDGPINIFSNGKIEVQPGATFTNGVTGNMNVSGIFQNDGAVQNNGFWTIGKSMISTGILTNNSTFSVSNGGNLAIRTAGQFLNSTPTAFFEIKGTCNLEGGTLLNLGGVRTVSGGIFSSSGIFNNKNVVNNAGEFVNNGVFNNGFAGNPTGITLWNEAGGVFRNNQSVNNYATLEILQCSKFYQNSANFTPILGKVWLMGIVFELKGTIDQSSIMGGIVLKNENDQPKPMAMCRSAVVTLDATGRATVTPDLVDNMSIWDYCSGGSLTVSPATLTCANVGQTAVTLTARDFAGNVSSCTTNITVNASAACGNSSCVTTATRTISPAIECANGNPYGIWLNGLVPGKSNYYQIQNGVFTENADGTANLTGLAVNNSDPEVKFAVDFGFRGRTFETPSGSPKASMCFATNFSNWYFYTSTTGTLTGLGSQIGGKVSISRSGPAFQIGMGGNLQESAQFGGSGWFLTQVLSNPAGVSYASNGGDINVRLSGKALFECTQPPINPAKCYKLINKTSSLSLDVSGVSCADGANLQQWGYGGQSNQQFKFTDLGDGTYRITSQNSGKSLDIYGGSVENGAALIQWTWHGGDNQRFILQPVGDGFVKIISKKSGKAIQLSQNSSANGVLVNQNDFVETCEQAKWQLVEVTCAAPVCGQATCNKNILLVVGNVCLNYSENLIKNKLCGKGFIITTKAAANVTSADAAGKGLILISSTTMSTDLGTRLTHLEVPILNWEPQLFDDLNLSTTNYGLNYISSVADISIQGNHPITAGLSGNVNLFCNATDAAFGQSCGAGNSLANYLNNGSRTAILVYERGQTMCNGAVAAEKRIGFPLYDNNAGDLTWEGWKLFFNAIYWATNCPNVTCATANPNHLVFNAYKKQFDVEIKWINRKAKDVKYYTVERSVDGQNWASLVGFDGDFESEYFSERDENPAVGDNFYRLKLTLLDDSDIYTEEQMIRFEHTETFQIFPNPAAEITYMDLKSLAGKSADIHFVNQLGRSMKILHIDTIPNEPFALEVSDLANGLWLLQVDCEGYRSETVKLMVTHLD